MEFILTVLLPTLIKLILVLVAGFVLAGVSKKLITKIMEKSSFDVSLIRFLARSAKVAIIVLTIIIAIGLLGIPTTGLIAGVSAVAAAIALALQGSLSNIAGGIFILMTRPFKTGDFIDISGSVGTVKDIQLIHTVITTVDNKEIIMPNSVVVNSTVVNYSNCENRRVDLVFSISYDSDARLAEEIIFRTAMAHMYTITEPAEPFVRESAHSQNSIEITARVWCKAENYWTLYFDLIEKVREEFTKNGIVIPYNQLDVHITQ
ncbi:MAG: mechanosensitive ion channel [Clostridia bacterium]|nr:mechanosensitive ion channel [Clostridia bacterium]